MGLREDRWSLCEEGEDAREEGASDATGLGTTRMLRERIIADSRGAGYWVYFLRKRTAIAIIMSYSRSLLGTYYCAYYCRL